MHKNHRRKNKFQGYFNYWPKGPKNLELNQRIRKRRQGDRLALRAAIRDDQACEKIRKFEKPVDWWNVT